MKQVLRYLKNGEMELHEVPAIGPFPSLLLEIGNQTLVMNVLVTGATGAVGPCVVQALQGGPLSGITHQRLHFQGSVLRIANKLAVEIAVYC